MFPEKVVKWNSETKQFENPPWATPEKVLTKEEITEKVWGEIDMFKESRTLDIYIWYLRKKLWKDVVETVRGVGYMID